MMKRIIEFMVLAAVIVLPAGCKKDDNNDSKTQEKEVESIELSQEAKSMVPKVNASGWTLFGGLVEGEHNIVISPLSLEIALSMLASGSAGNTANELYSYLGIENTGSFNGLFRQLVTLAPKRDNKTKLAISNAAVCKDNYPFKEAYLNALKTDFDATICQMPFSPLEKVVSWVNNWCKDATGGMIPKLLDNIREDDVLILLNALYFKGIWKDKFDKEATSAAPFTMESGTKIQVPTMRDTKEDYSYAKNEIFSTVRLPYGNGAFYLDVLLPEKGKKVSDVIAWLKANGTTGNLKYQKADVDISLPKFNISFLKNGINKILAANGLPISMGSNPDYSGITDNSVVVSDIVQAVEFKLDENGTEAAAATAVIVGEKAAEPPVEFKADHPFVFYISESSTGAIFFSGAYFGAE